MLKFVNVLAGRLKKYHTNTQSKLLLTRESNLPLKSHENIKLKNQVKLLVFIVFAQTKFKWIFKQLGIYIKC